MPIEKKKKYRDPSAKGLEAGCSGTEYRGTELTNYPVQRGRLLQSIRGSSATLVVDSTIYDDDILSSYGNARFLNMTIYIVDSRYLI